MAHAHHPSVWEADAGGSRDSGQPEGHSEALSPEPEYEKVIINNRASMIAAFFFLPFTNSNLWSFEKKSHNIS